MPKSIPHLISEDIVRVVGGKDNIIRAACCTTRLRLKLRDDSKADREELKNITGIIGVVEQNEEIQIVLGPELIFKVTDEVSKITGQKVYSVDAAAEIKNQLKKKDMSFIRHVLNRLSNIFTQLIPAFAGCGLICGMSKTLWQLGILNANQYGIGYILGKAVFLYMNIMAGMFTAREFGGSESIGGSIAGVMMTPDLVNVEIGGEAMVAGQGGVIAVCLACYLGAKLERYLRCRIIPGLSNILTPVIVIAVIGIGSIVVIQPIGTLVTNAINAVVMAGMKNGRAVWGGLMSSTFLPIVATGFHRVFTPIETELIQSSGFDVLRPIAAMAGASQVGAAFAVAKRVKDKKFRQVIFSAIPAGILGVGEPLIFGVMLPLGVPFITSCLGAIGAGIYVAYKGVACTGIGISGLPLVLLMSSKIDAANYLIGLLIAALGGFVLTYLAKWQDFYTVCDLKKMYPIRLIRAVK